MSVLQSKQTAFLRWRKSTVEKNHFDQILASQEIDSEVMIHTALLL